jgi:hypothetical protein
VLADSRKLRRGVAFFVAICIFACPLAGSALLGTGAPAEARQIQFTPNVATLQALQTPQAPTIGPLVWSPGMRFDCPTNMPEGCRPDLVSLHGDDLFGWGEMLGEPGLVLVWITDETGTHFLVVSADDPQLVSLPGSDSFMELMDLRMAEVKYTGERMAEGWGSGAVGGGVIVALLALCPETAGTTCVIAGITAGATALGNIVRNAILSNQSQDRLHNLELGIIGRFRQMELILTGP